MFNRRKALLILILFLGAVVYDHSFPNSKFLISSSLSQFLGGATSSDLKNRIADLEGENENLRLQVFDQSIFEKDKIKVYSSYPFNNKKEIVIASGTTDGISQGAIVTLGGGILVGQVKEALPSWSIVRTIFDPGLQMAVRVGKSETDALFTGGNELTLSLISKLAQISPNDIVVSASRDLPYGLEVGRIKAVEEVKGTEFKKAIVEASFKLQDLKNVTVRALH